MLCVNTLTVSLSSAIADMPRRPWEGIMNMNDYSDFEPTYWPRRKDNGRWCVVLIRPDGSEREIGDFSSDSEARDWINTNAGKQIDYKAPHRRTHSICHSPNPIARCTARATRASEEEEEP